MSEPGRLPEATPPRLDDRQRFLRRVCAVTGSRQISWAVLAAKPAPRR
ncbi:hypothetical protein AB0A74_28710 [Saccharothrix sp. NPDC042600]